MELLYFNRLNKAVSEVDAEGIEYYAGKIISKCSAALILKEITEEMFEVVESNLTKMQRVAKAKDSKLFLSLLPLYSQKMMWEKGANSFFRESFNETLCRIRPLFLKKSIASIDLIKVELAGIIEEVNNYKFKVEDADYFLDQVVESIYTYAGSLELPEEAETVCVHYYPKSIIKHIAEAKISLLAKKIELPILLKHLKNASMVIRDWESTLNSLDRGTTFFKEKKEMLLTDMGYKRTGSDLFESRRTEPLEEIKKGRRSIPLLNLLKEHMSFSPEDAVAKEMHRNFLSNKLGCIHRSFIHIVEKLNKNTKKIGIIKVAKTGGMPLTFYWITKVGLKHLENAKEAAE